MTDPISRRTALGLAGSAALVPLPARPASAQRPYGGLPWAEARRIVARTRPPRFRDVNFDVRRFGATGDGTTNDTAAFATAIRVCSESGGGHVMAYNGQTGDYPPAFGPFTISRSSCTRAPVVFDVSGLPDDHVNGFTVRDCAFDGVVDPADRFKDVDGIRFTDVTINGAPVTS